MNREVVNFGSVAGGPVPTLPTFAQSALDGTPMAYLFYVKSDCSVACVTDDAQTPCAGLTWTGGTGATCRQAWNGLWALTDIDDTKCWKFSGGSANGVFGGDFSISAMNYATAQHSINGMLFIMSDANVGGQLRNESGAEVAVWFEQTGFPTSNNGGVALSYYGWHLSTMHRKGTHHNSNLNGGAESTDVIASNTYSASGTFRGGIGCNNSTSGQAMGGALEYVAVYAADLPNSKTMTPIMTRLAGMPQPDAGLVTWPATQTTLCFDKADGGLAECMADGFPYVDDRGARTWSGERATSKWAADPLDISSWKTVAGSPGVVTNVKAGPFFEKLHSNEMDRVVCVSPPCAVGSNGGNSYVRAPSAYTVCGYASVGDGGISDRVRIEVNVDGGTFSDGGAAVDCDFPGLTGSPTLKSCTATLQDNDGGVYVTGSVWLLADAGSSSVTLGHFRLNMGVTCEPAELSNVAVGDGYILFDISGWRSDALGAEHEIIWTPLSTSGSTSSTNSPSPDWMGESDVIYLHDAYDNSNQHIVTSPLHGYSLPGRVLNRFTSIANGTTDLVPDGVNLIAGQTYVSAPKWIPNGGVNCALSFLEDPCNGAIASCVAHTVLISGSGACPDQPPNLKIGQRYDNTVPTDAWILSLRHKTP